MNKNTQATRKHLLANNQWYLTADKKSIVNIYNDADSPVDPRQWDNVGEILPYSGSDWKWEKNETSFRDIEDMFTYYYADAYCDEYLSNAEMAELIEQAAEEDGDIVITYRLQGYYWHMDVLYYADKETIERECRNRETAKEVMYAELKEYNDWLNGEVYGYTMYSLEGEEIDDCCGFIGEYTDESGIEDETGIDEYLGEYDDFEQCVEANAELLGIEVLEEVEMVVTTKKTYKKLEYANSAAC